eukprot:756512-Hanusia_phi.AAC.4
MSCKCFDICCIRKLPLMRPSCLKVPPPLMRAASQDMQSGWDVMQCRCGDVPVERQASTSPAARGTWSVPEGGHDASD